MNSAKIKAFWVIVAIAAVGFYLVKGGKDFVLGLDLAGGSALTYKIDTSHLPPDSNVSDSVASLRDVVERRVNLFGVREPTVTTEYSRLSSEWRLVVELPGVTDVKQAAQMIGETPTLDFRTEKAGAKAATSTDLAINDFEQTKLTGSYIEKASLIFDSTSNQPKVQLQFTSEGANLFAQITKANVGKRLAIYLDGSPISIPVVNEEITGGKAVISGNFTTEEAKTLVGRLNAGALPLPISISGTNVVGPTLGSSAVDAGVKAALIGFLLVVIFMILWYRLPGVMAVIALICYSILMLALFKFVPVTLTSAGIAGFIISVGLAVDANVLTFERMKEEIRNGKSLKDAVEEGFARAWTSIRDSHTAAIIVSVILFAMGTSVVKGFAFTFFLGAVVSLISAQLITRVFMRSIVTNSSSWLVKFLFSSGFRTK
ncbi:MAG: protein-export rane protein SecD, preprotein translocase subunit SecD [Candidatus Nomurabacteria bacterium]|nr:protein-export rane protein SecD, preprotein translocase subunit SecD [Candidatus Nomurabacteria bacterium]